MSDVGGRVRVEGRRVGRFCHIFPHFVLSVFLVHYLHTNKERHAVSVRTIHSGQKK